MAGFTGRTNVGVSLNGDGGLCEPAMLTASKESCMSISGTVSESIGSDLAEAGDSDRVLEVLSWSSGLSAGMGGGEEVKRRGNGDGRECNLEGRRRCAKGDGAITLSFRNLWEWCQ